jgi:hypothetical protein
MSQSRRSETFVYYFPECVLVIKTRRFQGECVPDVKRLEFQLCVAPGDCRAIQLSGVQWQERNGLPELYRNWRPMASKTISVLLEGNKEQKGLALPFIS